MTNEENDAWSYFITRRDGAFHLASHLDFKLENKYKIWVLNYNHVRNRRVIRHWELPKMSFWKSVGED